MNQPINIVNSQNFAIKPNRAPDEFTKVIVDKKLFQEIKEDIKTDEKTLKLQKRQSKSTLKMLKNDIDAQIIMQKVSNAKKAKDNEMLDVIEMLDINEKKTNDSEMLDIIEILDIKHSDTEFDKLIDECRNNPYGYSPIQYAIAMKRLDVLKYLIEAKEDVNATTPLIPIYDRETNRLLGYKGGVSALMNALDDIEMFELLLANGAKADSTWDFIINDKDIEYKDGPYDIKVAGYTDAGYIMRGKMTLLEIAEKRSLDGLIDPKIVDLIKNALNS